KEGTDDCWRVEDGLLTLNHEYKGGGDLVTNKVYENYILNLEWKISRAGNSGILINVQEGSQFPKTYISGPEMQVLDNKDASDNKKDTHLAGSLYDLVSCNPEFVHPAGEWNKVKIRQKDGHLTFWINTHEVVDIQIGSPEWNNLVANSKFGHGEKYTKYFGKFLKGHIALQDHGHRVWFRNIQIREL
ncbi:MAG TPA: DUF1080 domain-containing protein, partial [Flavobacteriaceae bacterium]|nr:DUF1080 domain-containing protein [Flavobacteriaceae bacterium]